MPHFIIIEKYLYFFYSHCKSPLLYCLIWLLCLQLNEASFLSLIRCIKLGLYNCTHSLSLNFLMKKSEIQGNYKLTCFLLLLFSSFFFFFYWVSTCTVCSLPSSSGSRDSCPPGHKFSSLSVFFLSFFFCPLWSLPLSLIGDPYRNALLHLQ